MKKLITSLALAILLVAVVLVGMASADRPESKAAPQAEYEAVIEKTGPLDMYRDINITYTIVYSNAGDNNLTDVVITDILPTGLTYITDTSGLTCTACAMGATGTLTWYVGDVLTASSPYSFALVAHMPITFFGDAVLTNTVQIDASEPITEASDTHAVNVAPSVLTVAPADGATDVDIAANVTAVFNVPMDETTVNSTTFTLENSSGAVTGTVTYDDATHAATFDPGNDLDYTTTYTATLAEDLAATNGITRGKDYVWSFATRARRPVLAIAKTVVPTDDVALGSVVAYTVSIANNGDADATGVVITDNLPALVEFGGYVSNPGGIAQPPGPAGTITWTHPVSAGTSYSFVFTATVTPGTAFYGTDVTNIAYFTSTNAGSGYDDAVFTIEEGLYYIYLPLVMRNFTGTVVLP